jgi:hypothetical protein
MLGLGTKSVALVADESHNHAVQVEEEHQEVEAQLDERFLAGGCPVSDILCGSLAARQKLTFLCTFSLRKISVASSRCWLS